MQKNVNGKRSVYNILYSIIGQAVTILMNIILPRLLIVYFGSATNGLLSSVSQVFIYVNLLEAGVGTATLQALYGPVARSEKENVNAIMAATHQYYKKAGIWYFIAVVALSVGFPLAVKSEVPIPTVVGVVFFSGIGGVINFFFQGKYRLLLTAEGKGYVVTNLVTVTFLLTSILKIVLIMMGCNVVFVQIAFSLASLLQMIYMGIYIKKKYKWLDLKVKPNYNAISQKNSVLVHQISSLVFNNTDILLLTIFCDLKVVSVYSMYRLILGSINTVAETISTSIQFALGQAYNTDKEKYLRLHDIYELSNITILFSCYSIAYIFILPFIKLYTAGVTDINYIDKLLPVLFISTFLLSSGRLASSMLVTFAGHFRKTQGRAILEAVINITVSLIFVNIYGIYGVLLGTVAALLYRANDLIIYANKVILHRSPWVTYKRWMINLAMLFLTVYVSNFFHPDLNSYISLFLYAALYAVIIIPSFFLIAFLADREVFKNVVAFSKI